MGLACKKRRWWRRSKGALSERAEAASPARAAAKIRAYRERGRRGAEAASPVRAAAKMRACRGKKGEGRREEGRG
jgi:hypothetical protein